MAIINASDVIGLNNSVYSYGQTAKISNQLPTSLQSSTGNNPPKGSITKPVTLDDLQAAINILEKNFSNNCCQSQCHVYSTISSCQVAVCQSATCQTATCQYCQGCQSCQKNCSCQSQCSYYNDSSL